ncbi:MAG: galactokinase family protein [Candidatus Latescibacterota bacterium]|nr:galactokinase family protein [Candidatus Latescibacterota bacterium]
MKLAALLDAEAVAAQLAGRFVGADAAEQKAALFAGSARALLATGIDAGAEARALFVPGRVEVLGKHTDYAGGRSIVAALERGFCMVVHSRADARVRIHAVDRRESADCECTPELEVPHGTWANYPLTVVRRLARNFGELQGADIAFQSDLPQAAGMSSSSALMVGTFLALEAPNKLAEREIYRHHIGDELELAAYLGTVENGQSFGELAGDRGVGTFGGSEDHTAILCSQAGQLGQFAYCPARIERRIGVPDGYALALGFSGVVAEKTGAAQALYNRAAGLVTAIVETWREETGRDEVYLADVLASGPEAAATLRGVLAGVQDGPFAAADLIRRLEHFACENGEIVGPAGDALSRGDFEVFGQLVDRSQALTSDLLQNQVPQTVALATQARAAGAMAASAFGAGFGGSVWALIEMGEAGRFLTAWRAAYAMAFSDEATRADFFLTQAGPAAFALGE